MERSLSEERLRSNQRGDRNWGMPLSVYQTEHDTEAENWY